MRSILYGALEQSPGTSRELAARTQIAIGSTRETLNNMCRSREVFVLQQSRVDGVKRPVPIYAIPDDDAGMPFEAIPDSSVTLVNAMASWADFE